MASPTPDTPGRPATSIEQISADSRPDLEWLLANADEAMRARLRELATPPWPEIEPPETQLQRLVAPNLLGLLRDAEAIDTLLALIPFANERRLDYAQEDCAHALAAIGRPIIPKVIGRMLAIERDGDLYNPDVRADDDTSEYWSLGNALAFLASSDPSSHDEIAAFFRDRVTGLQIPPEHVASRESVWIDIAQHARIPEIDDAIRAFLESLPDGYRGHEFGTAAQGLAEFAPDRRGIDLQRTLEASYHDTVARFDEHQRLNAEWGRYTRDEWYEHLLEGTGPFARDRFDSIETTPELLAMLRETVAPPWGFSEAPEDAIRNDLPVSAALLLGLHGTIDDTGLLLEVLREAITDDWDWMVDVVPYAVAALGPAALDAVIARIEALESGANLDESAEELGLLIATAGGLADAWPEAIEPFAAFAAPRIADPANDTRSASDLGELTIAEAWVSSAFAIVHPRLETATLGFFDRVGHASDFLDVGDRTDYLERPARLRRLRPRDWLEYRYLDHDRRLRKPARPEDDQDFDLPASRFDVDAFLEYVKRLESGDAPQPAMPVTRTAPKIGRNDPCPCGSGKKYKKCCGRG